ncbi:MAG: hypothetical protein WCE62_17285 [Polyangiales bacterium]
MFQKLMLGALLLATAACQPKFAPQTVQVPEPQRPQRVLPTIRVLDAGMTPHVPVRYRVPSGTTETLYLELARAQAMRTGEHGAQNAIPPIQLQVEIGPTEPTPEGFIRQQVKITQLRISNMAEKMSPAKREQMEKVLAPLLNVQGWSEMDIQGRVRRSEFQGLKELPPNLLSMLANVRTALLAVPFPDEPLGAQGRWEVERRLQFAGIWANQVVTYLIEKMERNQLQLRITVRQTASPQPYGNGRLEAYQASVIGTATVRLNDFTSYSEAEATSQMRIVEQTTTGPHLLRINTRTEVRLYPAEASNEFGAAPPEQEPDDPGDGNLIRDPDEQQPESR